MIKKSISIKYDYPQISNIFSKVENTTIEKFVIRQKVERVKELITNKELNFTEIAHRLNYSSSAYLAKQFKEITGFTLSQYKKQSINKREPLDRLS
jgi:AraC-like DNA-binding protein